MRLTCQIHYRNRACARNTPAEKGAGKQPKTTEKQVAEREGFEPSVQVLPVRRFSKPLLSTTQPPLRSLGGSTQMVAQELSPKIPRKRNENQAPGRGCMTVRSNKTPRRKSEDKRTRTGPAINRRRAVVSKNERRKCASNTSAPPRNQDLAGPPHSVIRASNRAGREGHKRFRDTADTLTIGWIS
jgi:hypothetical protein